MSEAWVELDEAPEASLPEHARDGRHGDRVSFTESGLLHVRNGRATFARWTDILGVVEQGDRAYVLVPRRPPSPPWIEVDASMIGDEPEAVKAFAKRLRERGGGGGYRDAVKQRRQNLDREALLQKVRSREPVPGALEVPSTVVLGRSYPGLGPVQALSLMGGAGLGYALSMTGVVVSAHLDVGGYRGEPHPLAILAFYVLPFVGIGVGAWAAREIGRRWRAAKDRTFPRQRVLVLAPDGCIVGFRAGVRTLKWAMVGAFGEGPTEHHEWGLIVTGPNGEKIGDVDAGYLDAPLSLVVAVAEAYRRAAA